MQNLPDTNQYKTQKKLVIKPAFFITAIIEPIITNQI